jgi:hypothetical protein
MLAAGSSSGIPSRLAKLTVPPRLFWLSAGLVSKSSSVPLLSEKFWYGKHLWSGARQAGLRPPCCGRSQQASFHADRSKRRGHQKSANKQRQHQRRAGDRRLAPDRLEISDEQDSPPLLADEQDSPPLLANEKHAPTALSYFRAVLHHPSSPRPASRASVDCQSAPEGGGRQSSLAMLEDLSCYHSRRGTAAPASGRMAQCEV